MGRTRLLSDSRRNPPHPAAAAAGRAARRQRVCAGDRRRPRPHRRRMAPTRHLSRTVCGARAARPVAGRDSRCVRHPHPPRPLHLRHRTAPPSRMSSSSGRRRGRRTQGRSRVEHQRPRQLVARVAARGRRRHRETCVRRHRRRTVRPQRLGTARSVATARRPPDRRARPACASYTRAHQGALCLS